MSDIEQKIKVKVESAGVPLKKWDVEIFRGVLTGCNDAFIITSEKRNEILANCIDDTERERTAELIRPILRGRDIKRYSYEFAEQYIIATFPSKQYNIDDYQSLKSYLLGYGIEKLEQTGKKYFINGEIVKARKKTNNKWFETQDSISYWDEFSKPKIVWGNLNTSSNFAIAPEGMFINAPACMLIPGNNYLLAVLNSKIADYYIRTLGVVRNGGFFEYKPMFIEQIPIPKITEEQEAQIDTILSSSLSMVEKDAKIEKIIDAIYGLSEEEITFLHNQ